MVLIAMRRGTPAARHGVARWWNRQGPICQADNKMSLTGCRLRDAFNVARAINRRRACLPGRHKNLLNAAERLGHHIDRKLQQSHIQEEHSTAGRLQTQRCEKDPVLQFAHRHALQYRTTFFIGFASAIAIPSSRIYRTVIIVNLPGELHRCGDGAVIFLRRLIR